MMRRRIGAYRRARVLTGSLGVVGFGLLALLEPLAWPLVIAAGLFLAVSVIDVRAGFSNPNVLVVLDAVIVFGVIQVARPFPGAEAAALALTVSSAVMFATGTVLRLLLPTLTAVAIAMGVGSWVFRSPVEWSSGAMVGNAVVSVIALSPVLFWMGSSIARALPSGANLISTVVPDAGQFSNAVTERIGEGIAVIDLESTIRYANRAFAEMFGHERDALVGRSMAVLMDAETYARHLAAVQHALLSRKPVDVANLELVGLHREGHPVTVLLSVSELPGDGERLVLGAVRDVSEMVELRAQLEAHVASKDQFIATVAHELRTPLTAVVAFSEMLVDRGDLSQHEREEFMGLIADQARELGYLIEDLLVAARVGTETLSVSLTPTDLETEIVAAVGPWATHSQLDLDRDALRQTVMADPGRLRQVLRNLVANAVKHGGPHIELSAGTTDGWCQILVRDDGKGVPPGREQAIFDAYVHGHDTGDTAASAGLGLHVSRHLVELMGGSLRYQRALGHTEFVVTLPLAPDRAVGPGE